ncbi:nucleotidyl transferase AbiEii/AbiGii toxin family protein [Kribbella sp. NPDC058693]|uniref:nucleotidyl transferase AbiEii/AbiGii toxin family protein n=1 Tax=Kribbella sp. NPDC058693 TaxID=3346602 RepID=UPI00364DC92D
MDDKQPYGDWPSLSRAIKEAAKKAVAMGAATDVDSLIRQAYFDRFLTRVFAAGGDSDWLLKGGVSMLARVPRTRATKDVDLASPAADLDEAENALKLCVDVDMGDHVTFRLSARRPTGLGDNQPGVATRRLLFTCYDAETGRRIGDVPVDLVVGPAPVGRPETVEPANRLKLGRPLVTRPYRLYPVVDQVADKVCATMATNYPGGKGSSRVKDLVDLVVITRTQQMDLRELGLAIDTKRRLSGLEPFERFRIPADWTAEYTRLAKSAASVDGLTDAGEAEAFVAQLVDPALQSHGGLTADWMPGAGWTDRAAAAPSSPGARGTQTDGRTAQERQQVRGAQPLRDHRRTPRDRGR